MGGPWPGLPRRDRLCMNAYMPYIVTDIFCALYAFSTFMHLNPSIGSEHEVQKLRNMILLFIVFTLCNIVWAACEGGLIHIPALLSLAVSALLVMSLTFGCYFWFLFVEARLHPDRSYSAMTRMLCLVPAAAIALMDALSIFTGWLFTLDSRGLYTSTDAFIIQSIVNFGYLLIPTVEFFIRAVRTDSREMRKEYLTYGIYMIVPLTFGYFEDCFPTVPVLELSIFLMIHVFFVTIQDLQIHNDALTGLNNRQRLYSYMRDTLPAASEKRPLFLSMIDIDSFKSVNDKYGHIEGDRALKAVARSIMKVSGSCGAFAARYGGDEFCIVSASDPAEMRKALDSALAEASQGLPCEIHVSMGYTECRGREKDPPLIIGRADYKLYEEKKTKHGSPISSV